MIEITNSEISRFFMCPTWHDFYYVRKLTPKRKAIALYEGSAGHSALEVFYKGGSEEEALASLERDQLVYMEHLNTRGQSFDVALQKFICMRALLTVYFRTVGKMDRKRYTFDHVEEKFNVPIFDPDGREVPDIRFCGKIDGIWTSTHGRKVTQIAEHKFFAQFDENRNSLMLDQQLTLYSLAARMAFGVRTPIVLYNVCKKPQNRMMKKSKKRDTDETPEEFFERVRGKVAENPDEFFRRVPVTRGPAHFKRAQEMLYKAAMMISGKEPIPYRWRNVGRHCVEMCPFREPCNDETPGMLQQMYDVRKDVHQELVEVEEVEEVDE